MTLVNWVRRPGHDSTIFDVETGDAARRASHVLLVRVGAVVIAFTLNVLIARRFGASQTGLYFLSLSTVHALAVLGRVGLDKTIVRFVSQRAAENSWGSVAAVYRQSVVLTTAVSAVLAIAFAGLAPVVADRVFSEPELADVLGIMAVAVIPLALVTVHAEMLKALSRPVMGLLLSPTAVHLGVIVGVLIGPVDFGVRGVAVAYLVANTIGLLAGHLLVKRSVPGIVSDTGDFPFRLLLSTSLPFLVTAALVIVMGSTDTVMLGIFRTPEDVGVFGASTRIATTVALILLAFNAVVPPRFAVLHARGDLEALGRLARNAATLMTLAALPLVIGILVFRDPILSLFGEQFRRGTTALTILTIAHFVATASGTVTMALAMTGHQRDLQMSGILAALTNVALNAALIPRWGITGAAVATGFSLVLVNVLNGIHVYRRLGIVTMPGVGFLVGKARGHAPQ